MNECLAAERDVAIVLGYFNGQAHINEQLESIIDQTHSAFHIFLYDDGSETLFVLDEDHFDQDEISKINVCVRSQNVGFAQNFLDGLARINQDFEYYAFSDQDDVWYEWKLEKAIGQLAQVSSEIPALYIARTEIVNETGDRILGYSPLFSVAPSFANALVQNIGGGNTMVFNKAAKELICEAAEGVAVVSHDWWCYQVVTGAGGFVIYDPEVCLKYRQHSHNLIGSNIGWRARFSRVRELLQGGYRLNNDVNLKALSKRKHLLTINNQLLLDDFIQGRRSFLQEEAHALYEMWYSPPNFP